MMTGNDKTDRQLVAMAYLIFNRTNAYTDALKTWNVKAATDKTFANFKVHLRTEFHALRRVGALTIQNSSINMLRDITTHQDQLSANLGEQLNATMQANFAAALDVLKSGHNTDEAVIPDNNMINNQSSTEKAMMTMIKNTQAKMDALAAQISSNTATTSNTQQNISRRFNNGKRTDHTDPNSPPSINLITGRAYKRYCWTCGLCPHWGRNCPQKKTRTPR